MNKGVCVYVFYCYMSSISNPILNIIHRAVKIGSLSLSNAQNVENIIDALPLIVKKIPGKWDNILSVHLKSSESIALPIYSALPEGPVTGEDVAVEKVAVKA